MKKANFGEGFIRKFAVTCVLFLVGSMILDIAIVQGAIPAGLEWIVWGVLILLALIYLFPPQIGGEQ